MMIHLFRPPHGAPLTHEEHHICGLPLS
jgi:hypothetical protein